MTVPNDANDALVVRRLIPVPREHVFAAWLDPVRVARWMSFGGGGPATAELDPRVGGKFRIVMPHAPGDGAHWGEYLVIDRPSLLSFTWTSISTDLQPTVVTVELFERGTSTELVLTHRRLPPPKVDEHRSGWAAIVERIGAAAGT